MVRGRRLEALVRQFDRELSRLERDAIVRLDGALRLAANRLEDELRRLYPRLMRDLSDQSARGVLVREARARALLEQVRAALDLTSGTQGATVFTELIGGSFEVGAANAIAMLTAYEVSAASLSSVARLNVAARATQASARLAHHGQAFALKAEELIIDGITRGRGWRQTAGELRRETGVTRWKAEQLVRTESIQASDDVRRDTYAENGVEYVQRMATMDQRVCGYCATRAGNVYRADEAPAALHPNCRCYNAPWKKEWHDLGLTDDQWMLDHKRESLKRGERKPQHGVAPFERSAGLTRPPEPVWTPD